MLFQTLVVQFICVIERNCWMLFQSLVVQLLCVIERNCWIWNNIQLNYEGLEQHSVGTLNNTKKLYYEGLE
jgi:hypothetical protein